MESTARKDFSVTKSQSPTQIVSAARLRNITPAQIVEADRSQELILLQESLRRMRRLQLSPADFGYELRDFFEIIVRVETGLFSIRQGLIIFLDKFCAEPFIVKLFQRLFKQSQKLVAGNFEEIKRFDKLLSLSQVEEIINWYCERRFSLQQLAEHYTDGPHYDHMFDLRVFHDQIHCSMLGFEVAAGVGIFGRAGQNLWLKIFVKHQGEYVLPRVEWNSWIDDTEIFTVTKTAQPHAMSAIVPISPITQRLVIDRLTTFVPYAALDLPPGKNDIEIEASLYNERGDRLLTASTPGAISVPRSYPGAGQLISSQALGIWPKDFVYGDSLSNLDLTCIRQTVNDNQEDVINLKFDLELLDRVGEIVAIEGRFYRQDGSVVDSKSPQGSDNSVAVRKEINVTDLAYRVSDIELSLQRKQLILDESDRFVSCELCLLSADSRVLCGMLATLSLPTPILEVVDNKPAKVSKQKTAKKSFSLFQLPGVVGKIFSINSKRR